MVISHTSCVLKRDRQGGGGPVSRSKKLKSRMKSGASASTQRSASRPMVGSANEHEDGQLAPLQPAPAHTT